MTRRLDGRGSLAGQAGASFTALMGGAVLTAGLTIALIRILPKAEYGRFALVASIIGVAVLVTDAGVGLATSRRVAERKGDIAAQGAVVRGALWIKLAGGVIVSLGFLAGADAMASLFDDPDLDEPFRYAGIVVAGISMLQLCRLSLNADGVAWSATRVVIFESVLEVALCLALVLSIGTVASVIVGRGLAFAAGATVAVVVLLRRIPIARADGREGLRAVARLAPTLAAADAAWILFLQADVVLIGALLGPQEVATFEAPLRVLVAVGFVASAIGTAVGPRLAASATRQEGTAALADGLRVVLLCQGLLLMLWLGVLAPNATFVFGEDYANSVPVLYGLSPYLFLFGISPLLSYAVVYAGNTRSRAWAGLAALAVNVLVDLVLLREIGLAAALIGSSVGVAVYVLWHAVLVVRALEQTAAWLLRPLASAAIAAAASCGMLVAGSQLLSVPDEAMALPAGAVFALLTRRFGLWTERDLAATRARIRSISR